MSDVQPTPGPWKANCFLVTAQNGREVTHTGLLGRRHPSYDGQSGGQEDEANAALIAAAPDLLRACELAARQEHNPTCASWNWREPVKDEHCDCFRGIARAALDRASTKPNP